MSLIGDLLARHPDHRGPFPSENLLTAATAAVLNRCPNWSGELAAWLLGDGCGPLEGPVEAADQQPVGRLRRIDLELIAPGEAVVWIEVKDAAGESGNQLAAYRQALDERAERRRELVYLSRLGRPHPEAPVKVVRWQELGDQLADWLNRHDSHGFEWHLAHEFLTYLQERGLTRSEPLPLDLRERITAFHETRSALAHLHAMVSDRLETRWQLVRRRGAQRTGGTSPESWPAMCWSVFAAEPAGRYAACDFDWLLWGADADRVEQPTLHAGLVWRRDRGPSPFADQDWLTGMMDLRPDDAYGSFVADGEPPRRLDRVLALSALGHDTLADQADVVADFAAKTFTLLRRHA